MKSPGSLLPWVEIALPFLAFVWLLIGLGLRASVLSLSHAEQDPETGLSQDLPTKTLGGGTGGGDLYGARLPHQASKSHFSWPLDPRG